MESLIGYCVTYHWWLFQTLQKCLPPSSEPSKRAVRSPFQSGVENQRWNTSPSCHRFSGHMTYKSLFQEATSIWMTEIDWSRCFKRQVLWTFRHGILLLATLIRKGTSRISWWTNCRSIRSTRWSSRRFWRNALPIWRRWKGITRCLPLTPCVLLMRSNDVIISFSCVYLIILNIYKFWNEKYLFLKVKL